jgi:hypothetical protein
MMQQTKMALRGHRICLSPWAVPTGVMANLWPFPAKGLPVLRRNRPNLCPVPLSLNA